MRRIHQALPGLGILCLFFLSIASPLQAAEHHGQVLFGGLPVPGATVTLTLGEKHLSTITDQQGVYEFPDLPNGTWSAHIEMSGFEPMEGAVKVAAEAPQGAWELKMLGLEQMIAQTKALWVKPLERRETAPKAAQNATANKDDATVLPEAPRPQEDASGGAADGLLINGSENNAATSKYSISQAFGNRKAGPKSIYTGGLGIIIGNSALDARPYSITGLSLPKATYSRITGLATLGGPLNLKPVWYQGPNFFLAYQWTRDTNASTAQGLVPDAAQRSGDLSGLLNAQGQPVTVYNPVTKLPFVGPLPVSPQAKALLALYPLPNSSESNGASRYNYQTQVLSNQHIDALQSRLDKSIGHKDQVYGRFGFQSSRADAANLFHFRDTTNTLGLDGSANWSHRYLHQVFVNLGYHFTRMRTQIRPQFAGITDIEGNAGITGVSGAPRDWGPPELSFSSGFSGLTDAQSEFNRNRTDAASVSVQTTRRRHNFTFGGDFRRQEFNELVQVNPRGAFAFTGAVTAGAAAASGSDLADFLLGVPATAQLAFGNADKYFRQSVYDAYFSDDWRLRSNLTIVAGLRWDFGTPLSELFGRLVNLDVAPGFTSVAPVLGSSPNGPLTDQSYTGALIRPDRQSFEPRIGISWRPLPASTMVVRAGYGVYDDTSVYLSVAEAMAQQSPLSKSVSVANSAACPLTLANGFVNCGGTTANTFAVDPHLRVGYAQTWQLAVQRDLPGAMVATMTYLGVKGTRGMQEFLPNTYPIGAVNPCPACPSGFVYRTSNGNSTRQSAQVQVRRRLRSGLTASVDYTYSKSIDNDAQLGGQGHVATTSVTSGTTQTPSKPLPTPSIAQNWLNLRAERGLSTFDQRHLVKVTAQYTTGMGLHGGTLLEGIRGTLFKQWTLSSTFTAGTGLPEMPVYFATVPGTGITGPIRPDLTGAPIYQAPSGYFLNASAYSAPMAGQWGTARRNSITGPGIFSFDSSLARTFAIKMPFYLDIKLDATNLLNRVTYTGWNTTINSTTFGLPAAANAMRSLQINGRLRF